MARQKERTPFGERLHQARKAAKLTQPQLAKAAGMAQSTLAELEYIGNGSSFTAQLAEKLKVRPEWLANGSGPMKDAARLSDQVADLATIADALPPHLKRRVLILWKQALEFAHEAMQPSQIDDEGAAPMRDERQASNG